MTFPSASLERDVRQTLIRKRQRTVGMTISVAAAATVLQYALTRDGDTPEARGSQGMHLALLVGIGMSIAGGVAAALQAPVGSQAPAG